MTRPDDAQPTRDDLADLDEITTRDPAGGVVGRLRQGRPHWLRDRAREDGIEGLTILGHGLDDE